MWQIWYLKLDLKTSFTCNNIIESTKDSFVAAPGIFRVGKFKKEPQKELEDVDP